MVEVLDRIAECASRPRRATLAASASQGSSIFRIFVEHEFSSFCGSEFICLATPPDPYCQVLCLVICRSVGQLSGTVRCLCQTSCQVLSVLSGAVGCVSDRRGDL